MFDPRFRIDVENVNGSPGSLCQADKSGPFPDEVFQPLVATGMKQSCNVSGDWVDTGEVVTFVCIAPIASEREVVCDAGTVMFQGDNVIKTKR
jgi:hypothetical protein